MIIVIANLALIGLAYSDTVINTYDALNRITKIQYDNGMVVEYSFDKAGNRSQRIVSKINIVPTANAGINQIVDFGVLVTLNGTASNDPDNGPSPLSYAWIQSAGQAVTLTNGTTATPSFTPAQSGSYTFSLVVSDGPASSQASSVTITVNPPLPLPPTVTFMATPTNVNYQGASSLNWSSTDATSCTASGGWTGTQPVSGSLTLNGLTATQSYGLVCTGNGGTTTQSVMVTVNTPPPPTVTLTATPTNVNYQGASSLNWSSTDATSCTASGGWTGVQPVSGNLTLTGLSATQSYVLACTGNGGTTTQSVMVTVNPPPQTSPQECLLNWAENSYPALFSPAGALSQVLNPYTYRHYKTTNSYLGVSAENYHVYYLGPEGVMQDVGELSGWLTTAGCPPIKQEPKECLFNWAEKNYSNLFAPSGFITTTWDVYTYRYYSATKAYLGVSSVNNHVYYMGQDGVLLDEGALSDWLPKANCQ